MIFAGFVDELTLPEGLSELAPTTRARSDASQRPWTDLLLRQALKPFRWYFDQIDYYSVWTSKNEISAKPLGGGGNLSVLVCPKEEQAFGKLFISKGNWPREIKLEPGLCVLWDSNLKITISEAASPRVFWAVSLNVPLLP